MASSDDSSMRVAQTVSIAQWHVNMLQGCRKCNHSCQQGCLHHCADMFERQMLAAHYVTGMHDASLTVVFLHLTV